MRRLTLFAFALLGCTVDDGTRYLRDPEFRRAQLEASLTTRENRYSRERLAHYGGDWERLPEWNPPVSSAGMTQPLAFDDPALGEHAFFRYPAQRTNRGNLPHLVTVHYSDGSQGQAMTCATCHSRVSDGKIVAGLPNQTLDLGFGPGRVQVVRGEEPIAIPDLRPVSITPYLQRNGAVRNLGEVALAIRIETLIITAHDNVVRPPREIALALARYLGTLAPPSFDRPIDETFRERCASCHRPPTFSGGLVALDRAGTDPRVGHSADRGTGAYRVPSLRGVATRGALLHDGSVPDLPSLLAQLELDAGERDDLLAFLRSL